MGNIIHYENDLFYLNYHLRLLNDSLKLDLDPSIYKLHLRNEIAFLAETIIFFFDSLKHSQLKVNRLHYLKKLYDINKGFVDFLNFIITGQSPSASIFKDDFSQLSAMREKHQRFEKEIFSILRASRQFSPDENESLSEEEYRVLFAPDEEI